MYRPLANLSIRNNVVGIILVTTFVSLGTGFTLVILTAIESFEEDLIRTTGLIARVVGDYSVIGLAFDDAVEVERSLAKLAALPEITDAYVYDARGRLFETYSRSAELSLPDRVPRDVQWEIAGGHVHYFAPIELEGRRWGTIYVRASTAPLEERVGDYLVYMFTLMAALVVAAAVFAYLLQSLISKPILDLAAMAQRISATADYSERVEKPGDDEIGTLYEGFNNMLQQIQRRQEELERSNRDLDQFAYVASHDLKAPLRAITTLSGWLEEDLGERLDGEQREQMQLLRSRVRRMDELIDGILEYSRAGRLAGEPEPVDVGELLGGLAEMLDPPAGVRIEVAPGMPTLVTHRARLEQVFLNLVGNAIKHHDRDRAQVEVRARRRGGVWEFTVADDGPGIAPEYHEKIFDMFQTLEPRDRDGGTGVGLSLVKKLVEDEGGRIRVESGEGRGSRFVFTWPAVAKPPATASKDGQR